MSRLRRQRFATLLIFGLLMLAACAGPEPTPTPSATPTSTPSSTPTATPTLTPTSTPSTTATPTVTATLTATTTCTATASATSTWTPTTIPDTSTPTLPATDTLQPTLIAAVLDASVGIEPQAVAAAGGFIWVVHSEGTLLALQPDGTPRTTIQVTGGATVITTDGLRLWIAHRAGIVTQVEGTTGVVTSTWLMPCTECLLRGIHWDGAVLWVSNFAENTLYRTDITNGTITVIPAGAESPTMLGSSGSRLYVLHQSLAAESVVLTVHDMATGETLNGLTATGFPTAILSDGMAVWLSLREEETGTLVRLDAATLAVTALIEATPANALLTIGGSLWSADFETNTVSRRDMITGEVLDRYPVGELPQAMAYDNGFLWVVNRRAGTLTRLWLGM